MNNAPDNLTRGQRVNADITALLRARNTLLWIVTREELRVERGLIEAAGNAQYQIRFWDIATGLTNASGDSVNDERDPVRVINYIKDSSERCVYVLRDLHKLLDPYVLRGVRSLARELQNAERGKARAIVVLTPSSDVPPELAGHATVIDYPIPDRNEVAKVLDAVIRAQPEDVQASAAPNGTREAAIDAAVGLTAEEAANCYARSLVVNNKRIDPATVAQEKKRVIAREKVLTWYDPDPRGMDAVGGLDVLKKWLAQRRLAFSAKARAYGLKAPKGALLVGISGCGKSLTAKCIAAAWGMPLLRLDMGALRSKYVGDSEANIRKALAVAEAVAPCVDGDTMITLADGATMTARELYELGEQVDLMAVDDVTGGRRVNRLKAIVRKTAGDAGMVEIDALGGRLKCRADHVLLTREGWVEAGRLKPGDEVTFAQRAPSAALECADGRDFWPDGVRFADGQFRRGGGGYRDARVPRLPKTIDEAFGLLIGCIDSDGTWSDHRGAAHYRTSRKEHAEHFASLVEERFGLRPPIYVNDNSGVLAPGGYQSGVCYVVRLRSLVADTLRAVRQSLFHDRLSYLWAAWLRAFIQGDGSVSGSKITIAQKHGRIREDAIEMLRRFGVFVRDSDRLQIEVTGGERVSALRAMLLEAIGLPGDKIAVTPTDSTAWSFTRGVTVAAGCTFQCVVKSVRRWDDPEHEVYDLCCEDPHNYVSNGMVSHNCILWTDEIEKALGGSTGQQGDGGVSADALGTVLSWMQERSGSVFVIATANDVRSLPPELLRKGRFDEIFWVDLPTLAERTEILATTLKANRVELDTTTIVDVARETSNFTGAELAAIVPDAMFAAFADSERAVTKTDLIAAAESVVPLATTAEDKIKDLRSWAKGRARPASTPEAAQAAGAGRALDL